ncbi:hypothetical protein VNO78_32725 [Psophocarpus tetragonolobus]|uniref:Uncharacterized protein n=1 Tax=Psophocarpus tetragonolobus TaxID=3891 RepID=A0AAN9NVP0_PSOTE
MTKSRSKSAMLLGTEMAKELRMERYDMTTHAFSLISLALLEKHYYPTVGGCCSGTYSFPQLSTVMAYL